MFLDLSNCSTKSGTFTLNANTDTTLTLGFKPKTLVVRHQNVYAPNVWEVVVYENTMYPEQYVITYPRSEGSESYAVLNIGSGVSTYYGIKSITDTIVTFFPWYTNTVAKYFAVG